MQEYGHTKCRWRQGWGSVSKHEDSMRCWTGIFLITHLQLIHSRQVVGGLAAWKEINSNDYMMKCPNEKKKTCSKQVLSRWQVYTDMSWLKWDEVNIIYRAVMKIVDEWCWWSLSRQTEWKSGHENNNKTWMNLGLDSVSFRIFKDNEGVDKTFVISYDDNGVVVA